MDLGPQLFSQKTQSLVFDIFRFFLGAQLGLIKYLRRRFFDKIVNGLGTLTVFAKKLRLRCLIISFGYAAGTHQTSEMSFLRK